MKKLMIVDMTCEENEKVVKFLFKIQVADAGRMIVRKLINIQELLTLKLNTAVKSSIKTLNIV